MWRVLSKSHCNYVCKGLFMFRPFDVDSLKSSYLLIMHKLFCNYVGEELFMIRPFDLNLLGILECGYLHGLIFRILAHTESLVQALREHTPRYLVSSQQSTSKRSANACSSTCNILPLRGATRDNYGSRIQVHLKSRKYFFKLLFMQRCTTSTRTAIDALPIASF